MSDSISHETPAQAWDGLEKITDSVLVDVRTRAEWSFVGVPDIASLNKKAMLIEWKAFPTMETNAEFAAQVLDSLDGSAPSKIYFLCRSGVRSIAAAETMNELFSAQGVSVECVNVLEGFEGDLDSSRHRGEINGWKSCGLAWGQS